ncbi:hypothetical protein [Methylogaea oryzae]|uniref:Uncharacterized protein n=1 Tax=Methylogaea oryzae TaxID=1295382 RepID=A0A8D4VQB8_9GAMM|nr:hypothetical protein [Methylogaea oryzae]BBL71826.1 hypothetical protein MoryE10_24320 [Methylogaea oryzae]
MPSPLELLLVGTLMSHPAAVTCQDPGPSQDRLKDKSAAAAEPCRRGHVVVEHKPEHPPAAPRRALQGAG